MNSSWKLWELFVVCLKLKPGVEIDGMPTDHMEISETIQSLALAGTFNLNSTWKYQLELELEF